VSRLADRAAREHRVADITDHFELADRVLLQPFAQRREDPLATDAIPRPTLDTQPLASGCRNCSILHAPVRECVIRLGG